MNNKEQSFYLFCVFFYNFARTYFYYEVSNNI